MNFLRPLHSIIFFTVCHLPGLRIYAQTGGNGATVVVSVVNESGVSMDGATVALLREGDSTIIATLLSQRDGRAIFTGISKGRYVIAVSFAGYQKYYTSAISVAGEQERISLPQVRMIRQSELLQDVTVNSKKSPIEKTLDGVVVNVANSITAAGSSLFEVLTRAPGISVDQDDNIRLQAKAGVMILIDGKPVQLTGTDLANMLKAISASAIDKIEIITRPGSRYDAAGNAGVINIRMKKNQAMGANGTVTASMGAGVYPKASIGTSLNYRKGKINIFGNYTYSYRKSFSNPVLDRQFKSQDTVQTSYRQNDYISFPFH